MRRTTSILVGMAALLLCAGCAKDPSEKTDAELGLNAQQASGRRVFEVYCSLCHKAYSSSGMKGPGLLGLYKKEYLPSGLRAEDRFVGDTIVRGRKMMPPLGNSLTQRQVEDVMAYLHTL